MPYLNELKQALCEGMPEETVLVTNSRGLGRRMLAACAAEGVLLVGVRAETPFTLAKELCSGDLSRPGAPRLADDGRCGELVRECLRELEAPVFFKGENGRGMGAAEALYRTFLELEMACVPSLSGSGKLEEIEGLRRAYAQKKAACGLIDRADLFARALEQVPGSPLRGVRYVVPASCGFTPLERRLLDALSENVARVVEMEFPAEAEAPDGLFAPRMPTARTLPGLKGRTAFARCRGVETEVDYLFRDILTREIPVGECAVVCLSKEYAQRIYEAAGRFHLPVTLGEGIPLTGSGLYTGLKRISRLPDSNYDAEKVCDILSTTGCAPESGWLLTDALRKKRIGWGRERYENWAEKYGAVEKGRPDDGTLADWNRYFALMFRLACPEGDLAGQKTDLLEFITSYCRPANGEQASAYAQTLRLMERITALAEGESLLSRLLEIMEKSAYLFGAAAEGKLFSTSLSQRLCTGRRRLYVVGLSRYALQGSGKESPILLDEERAGYPALKTAPDREKELSFRFLEMLLHHEGEIVLTYPDFDSGSMLPQLPAPLYRQAMEACGGGETRVDYLGAVREDPGGTRTAVPLKGTAVTGELLTAARPPILSGPDPVECGEGEAAELNANKTLKEQIREYVFSPSSLETALACPLQFYYQKLLRIYPPDKLERRDGAWLEKNTVGTFCHRVLERYYGEKAADVTPIFQEEKERLKKENPAVRQQDMEAAFRRMEEMVRTAIDWTNGEKVQVLSTEADFGKAEDGMAAGGLKLKVGNRELLLTGSIDRVDQKPGSGKCAIVDYKTGDSYFFRKNLDKHLQHYLYTLAEEELYREEGREVEEAVYLFLAEKDDQVRIPQDKALRDAMAQVIGDLLAKLEQEETAQLPCPCFEYDQNAEFVPGGTETRQEAQKNCRGFCKYAALCPDVK